MKKNDIITLKITDINNLGYGVGHLEDGSEKGKTVFVNGAVTGDKIRGIVIKYNTKYLVAKLDEILVKSSHRTATDDNACDTPLACGGCIYRNISYEYELELKRNFVESAFRKAGLKDIEIFHVTSAGNPTHYRNKAQYPVTKTNNGVSAGFYAVKTHKIIPSDNCNIQHKLFPKIVAEICKFAEENNISVYDEATRTGILRHIYLRVAEATGEIMLCLVINSDTLPKADAFVLNITTTFPEVKSIFTNINKEATNLILGKTFRLLHGKDYIVDKLCNLSFRITPQSFYQINRNCAEILYRKAAELADFCGDETIYDIYCGIGTIGLSMADKVKTIVGAEIVEIAAEYAEINAKINNIKNARFYCLDATDPDLIDKLSEISNTRPDTVILDPPRKGCTADLIENIAKNNIKKIIYISCDPATLARDAAIFQTYGYSLSPVYPFDMFPRTGHVECVVLISRIGLYNTTC